MGNKLQSNIIYYHTKVKLNHYNVMKQEQITYYSTWMKLILDFIWIYNKECDLFFVWVLFCILVVN